MRVLGPGQGQQVRPTRSFVSYPSPFTIRLPRTNITSFRPYTSKAIGFYFGESKKRYTIHEHLAVRIPGVANILKTRDDGPPINFTDVDEDIGHSLVHYLYTGQYQTMLAPYSSTTSRRQAEYVRSVQIYAIGLGYRVKGLETLAKQYILLFEDSVDIFQILSVAKKEYGDIRKLDDWYPNYLVNRIQYAFEEDEDFFKREEFSAILGEDAKFDQFLMQTVISLYSEKVSTLKEKHECEKQVIDSHYTEPEPRLDHQPVESQSKSILDFWLDNPRELQRLSQAETEYGSASETVESEPLLDRGVSVRTPSDTDSVNQGSCSSTQSSVIDDELKEMAKRARRLVEMTGGFTEEM